MENCKLYFRRLKNWLFDAFPFWLFMGVFILAMVIPFLFQLNPVDHVYYTGFLLQFSAFLTIILRINWLHKYLSDDNSGFIGLIIEWFKRFTGIFKKPKHVNIDLNRGFSASGGSVANTVSLPDRTLEQRVEVLEENQRRLENNLRETESTINTRIDEIVNDINKQISEVKNEISSTKKETKEFKADSLKFEIVWSLWFIVGLTVSSFSEVIGDWFI